MHANNATLTAGVDGAWSRSGDPSESALLLAAAQLGVDVAAIQAGRDARRRRLFAFNARLKRMATLDAEPGGPPQIHAKGAPLELLARCTTVRGADGGERPLDAAGRAVVRDAFERYAAGGLRVLGFASRPAPDVGEQRADDRDAAESGLCFLGLIAMRDPLRPQVPAAVADCRRAGIRIIVITGDDGLTAAAVAREAGIVDEDPQVVTGPQLDAMTDDELDEVAVRLAAAHRRAQLAGGEAADRRRAARRGPHRRDDRRRRQRRAGAAPRRHRHRDGRVGHGRRA